MQSAPNGEARLAVLEEQMERLMGNGQPGIIKLMQDRQDEADRRWWKLLLGLAIISVASGGGTFSLKSLIELLSK